MNEVGIYGKANFLLDYLDVPGRTNSRKFIQFIANPDNHVNLSLLMNKGMIWWSFNGKLQAESMPKEQRIRFEKEDQNRRDILRSLKTPRSEHLESIFRIHDKNKGCSVDTYGNLLKRHTSYLDKVSRKMSITAKTAARLQIGSRSNPMESGLLLHPLYGFPYLPGSAIKGLTAAGYLYQEKIIDRIIKQNNGDQRIPVNLSRLPELIRNCPDVFPPQTITDLGYIFGMPRLNKDEPARKGGVLFTDAWPIDLEGIFDLDSWTVHYPDYYQGDAEFPGDDQAPIPLPQLTVARNKPFQFRLAALLDIPSEYLQKAGNALQYGLKHLSIGAKPDYGFFKDFQQETRED